MRWGYNSTEKNREFIELSAFLIGGKMILHGREVKVQVDDIEPFVNEKYSGFKILWSGDIGWGEYTLYKKQKGQNVPLFDSNYFTNTYKCSICVSNCKTIFIKIKKCISFSISC